MMACTISRGARADLPSTAPIDGAPESLEEIGAQLEQSVSVPRQDDPRKDAERAEAERRLRAAGDPVALAVGSVGTSLGVTMLLGGTALATTSKWNNQDCPTCLGSVLMLTSGIAFTLIGLVSFGDWGAPQIGRRHARVVDALVDAMRHPSIDAANAARRARLSLGWSLIASSALFFRHDGALHEVDRRARVRPHTQRRDAHLRTPLVTRRSLT